MTHPLDRVQRWMQSVITHPEGVARGIDSPAARECIDIAVTEIEQVVSRSHNLTSVERLNVYNQGYFARLMECLREEFPALAHALGQETFNSFAVGYIHARPSTSYTLAQLGANFPQHLRDTRPPRTEDAPPDWADFLIDLASLERTYAEVFDGPGVENQSTLSPGDLRAISADDWSRARLIPVPCLRLLRARFPVHEYATAVRQGNSPSLPEPAETNLAITRSDYVVRRRALSAGSFELLERLARGESILDAITHAAASLRIPDDQLAAELAGWFHQWGAAGYFECVEVAQA